MELIYQLLMDNDLTTLHKEAARTDRLVYTPTPVSYTRHISRSIMLWLIALPVVATDEFRIELVPGAALLSWQGWHVHVHVHVHVHLHVHVHVRTALLYSIHRALTLV